MKKKTWILSVVILILTILCANLWQQNTAKENNLKVMCKSSVNSALEHFQAYDFDRKESDYIAGVAEFRTYMTAYLCLADETSDTDYTWCNMLYGYMTLHPDKVKAHIPELVDALTYLAEDYRHPGGFQQIHSLNNILNYGVTEE